MFVSTVACDFYVLLWTKQYLQETIDFCDVPLFFFAAVYILSLPISSALLVLSGSRSFSDRLKVVKCFSLVFNLER